MDKVICRVCLLPRNSQTAIHPEVNIQTAVHSLSEVNSQTAIHPLSEVIIQTAIHPLSGVNIQTANLPRS